MPQKKKMHQTYPKYFLGKMGLMIFMQDKTRKHNETLKPFGEC